MYGHYTITTQAQIAFLITAGWQGTFGAQWLRSNHCANYELGMIGEVFDWKIEILERIRISGSAAMSKSPDTWLRKPYKPNVVPLSLPE